MEPDEPGRRLPIGVHFTREPSHGQRQAMKVPFVSIGALAILATLLPLIRSNRWWIRIFDYPRLQIAVVIAATLVILILLDTGNSIGEMVFLAVLLLAFAYQAARIFPYTRLARPQVLDAARCAPGSSLRLLIANVLMSNRRSDALLRLIETAEPDLLLLVETDSWWDRQIAELDERYPFSVKHPLDNTYGLHLFSRLELERPELRHLVEDGIPSVETDLRLRSGQLVTFFGVHPRPPRPAEDTEERDAELLLVGRAAKMARHPVIVAGDLNDVAWSHTTRLFQKISGLLDPRVGRGLFATFHATIPIARWPLDHVFQDASFKLVDLRRLAAFGSDHFPILVELCYEPSAAAEQEIPVPESGDQAEAKEKIQEGLEENSDVQHR